MYVSIAMCYFICFCTKINMLLCHVSCASYKVLILSFYFSYRDGGTLLIHHVLHLKSQNPPFTQFVAGQGAPLQ